MTDFSDLTGEPALLKTYATRYLQIADAIQSASAALTAVGEGSDSMVSLAVNEVNPFQHGTRATARRQRGLCRPEVGP